MLSSVPSIALTEPATTAAILAVFAALMAFSVLVSKPLTKVGIPVVLIFMLLGMLGGSEGIGGIEFDNHEFAFRAGTVALVLILFDGGLNTSWNSVRRSLIPAGLLATVGVVLTAGIVALVARALGLSWAESLLIGAIVSSTDAAAVFAVLRGGGIAIRSRVRDTIEVESCINDPMAVVLTLTLVELLAADSAPGWTTLASVPLQFLVGFLVGAAIGYLAKVALTRVRLPTVGLYPVLTLSAAFLSFGAATLLAGSGFLAVFVTALILGRANLPYRAGLTRVHDAIAWLSQVCMFVMLGLLVFPSRLLPVAGIGFAIAIALSVAARPLAAALCLLPLRWPRAEAGYVGWVGIRGAVPIILATFPMLAGLPHADRLFHIVFVVVAVSAIIPGATIGLATRILRLAEPSPPIPAASIEMHSLTPTGGSIFIYYIQPTVAACNATLAQLSFPKDASVILMVRGEEVIPARGSTQIRAGDFVYVYCQPEDEPSIGLHLGPSARA